MLEISKSLAATQIQPVSNEPMMSRGGGDFGAQFLEALQEIPANLTRNVDTVVILAILGVALMVSLVIFIALVEKKKAPRWRFFRWLREYLNFRSLLISGLLKFLHLFLSVLITAFGIVLMFQGSGDNAWVAILIGILVIVAGNIILRLISELIMLLIGLWENTNDIRAVLVEEEERPEEKVPKEKKPKEKKEKKEKEEEKTEVAPEIAVNSEPVAQKIEIEQPVSENVVAEQLVEEVVPESIMPEPPTQEVATETQKIVVDEAPQDNQDQVPML